MSDLKVLRKLGNPRSEDSSRKLSSKQSGGSHENDYFGVCPQHVDTCWFAQAVLNGYSQYSGVSDQQRTLGASELWDSRGYMDRQRGKP